MASGRAPPNFHNPKEIRSPEFSIGSESYVQDGILYRTFRTINPM